MRLSDWIPLSRFELEARIAREVRLEVARQLNAKVFPHLANIDRHVQAVEEMVTELGAKVAAVDDALAQLDEATNDVAADLEALKVQVAGFDSDTAAKIQAAADRLRALAADPENPVPPVEEPPAA